jgi:hypothetical protein
MQNAEFGMKKRGLTLLLHSQFCILHSAFACHQAFSDCLVAPPHSHEWGEGAGAERHDPCQTSDVDADIRERRISRTGGAKEGSRCRRVFQRRHRFHDAPHFRVAAPAGAEDSRQTCATRSNAAVMSALTAPQKPLSPPGRGVGVRGTHTNAECRIWNEKTWAHPSSPFTILHSAFCIRMSPDLSRLSRGTASLPRMG